MTIPRPIAAMNAGTCQRTAAAILLSLSIAGCGGTQSTDTMDGTESTGTSDGTGDGDGDGDGDGCPSPGWGLFQIDLEGGELAVSEVGFPKDEWWLPGPMGAGDFDGDGNTDLVVGPRIVFGPMAPDSVVEELDVGELVYTGALAVDLDGDGRDELMLGLQYDLDSTPREKLYECSAERVVTEIGVPSWHDGVSSGALELGSGDVTGDGFVDIVIGAPRFTVGAEIEAIAVLEGDGTRGFSGVRAIGHEPVAQFTSSVVGLGVAQIDGAGGLDIVSAHSVSSGAASDFILTTTAIGGQDPPIILQTDLEAALYDGAFGDLDADGRPDAVLFTTELQLARGLMDGAFGSPEPAFEIPFGPPWTFVVADLDEQDTLDLMIGGSRVSLAAGMSGSLADPSTAEAPGFNGEFLGPAVADVDNDGDLEAVAYARWCEVEEPDQSD